MNSIGFLIFLNIFEKFLVKHLSTGQQGKQVVLFLDKKARMGVSEGGRSIR